PAAGVAFADASPADDQHADFGVRVDALGLGLVHPLGDLAIGDQGLAGLDLPHDPGRPGHVAQVVRTGEGAALGVRPPGPAQVPHDGGLRAGPNDLRADHVTSSSIRAMRCARAAAPYRGTTPLPRALSWALRVRPGTPVT